jgi:hypothetical protein
MSYKILSKKGMKFLSFNASDLNFKNLFETTKVVHVNYKGKNCDSFYRKLAQEVGFPLVYEEDPLSGDIIFNKWTEIKYLKEKELDTYKHSNKSQPLHTDYGYFSFEIFAAFFYCVKQAEFGGATTFVDVETVVRILKMVNPLLFQTIQKTKICFGRGENVIAQNTDFILSKDSVGWRMNWNYFRGLNDKQNINLIEDFKGFLDCYIEKSGELEQIKLCPGEGVFFHDRRVLHGRNSFVGDRQLNKGGIVNKIPKELESFLNSKV